MDIYEDKIVKVELPDRPACKGHVRIDAEGSLDGLSEDQVAHILSSSSFASTILFESVGAQGSNIVVTDVDGIRADILARFDGDGINLRWDALQLTPQEMDEVAAKIRDKCDYIEYKEEPEVIVEKPVEKPKVVVKKVESENPLYKHLDRIP